MADAATRLVLAVVRLVVQELERFRGFTAQNLLGKLGDGLFAREPKHVEDVRLPDLVAAKGDELIEH